MNEPFDTSTLSALIDSVLGGALTTLAGAAIGRLMYHVGEVRKRRRRFLSRELVWELPICFGMAVIGESVVSYLGLPQPVSTGVIAALAYLGPRGAEVILLNWLSRKTK